MQDVNTPNLTSANSPSPSSDDIQQPSTLGLKSKKRKFFIILLSVLLIIIATVWFVLSIFHKKSIDTTTQSKSADKSVSVFAPKESTPVISPISSRSPLAPTGTTDFAMARYRMQKATIAEAQAVQARIGSTFGNIVLPNKINFIHTEVYKGITIEWTAGQPIPADRLAWIKSALDILPEYFYKDNPATTIISATYEELGSQGTNPNLQGAMAYASGLNMFLTSRFTTDSVLGSINKKDAVHGILHEWTHIVQHYEVLRTFSESYLSIPGNLLVVFNMTSFTKDYARVAGWVFQDDQYADSTFAKLGTDTESQKTTEYGRTSYVEDQAESAANFFTCDTSDISKARIAWWEKTTGKTASSFCPAKF